MRITESGLRRIIRQVIIEQSIKSMKKSDPDYDKVTNAIIAICDEVEKKHKFSELVRNTDGDIEYAYRMIDGSTNAETVNYLFDHDMMDHYDYVNDKAKIRLRKMVDIQFKPEKEKNAMDILKRVARGELDPSELDKFEY